MEHWDGGLHAVEEWLSASIRKAKSETLLPLLIGLPPMERHRQMSASPALRTFGVLHSLLAVGHDAIERMPRRALELTAVVIQYASSVVPPAGGETVPLLLEGQAWRDRADALRRLGRTGKAWEAIAAARDRLERVSQREWYLATVDLVEALLLDDCGRTAEALQRVRRAAPRFEEKGTRDRYVQAVMLEASIVWSAGDRAAAAGVWRAVAERARLRQDAALAATLEARIGLFELAHGDPGHAETMLVSALSQLDRLGVAREAARTRWSMAEAAAAAGRPHPAVSALYKVHAALIGVRDIRDAAIVSARILELLLLTGRDTEAALAARTFADTFREAEMPPRCFTAIAWLERRAAAAALTPDDARDVGRYFEEAPEKLRLQPHPWTRLAAVG